MNMHGFNKLFESRSLTDRVLSRFGAAVFFNVVRSHFVTLLNMRFLFR